MSIREYSLIPEEIPSKKKKEKRTLYTTRDISTWDWLDFIKYWDAKYLETFNQMPPLRSLSESPKYKGMIDPSLKHWGPEYFKEMIDWIFANYYRYPKLGVITIGVVCGKHYWVEVISQEVAKERLAKEKEGIFK